MQELKFPDQDQTLGPHPGSIGVPSLLGHQGSSLTGVLQLPESSPLGLRDGVIRIPQSLSTLHFCLWNDKKSFPAFKVTGKKWFPRLYFTPSTLIVQNTSALDPGQPGSSSRHFQQRSASLPVKGQTVHISGFVDPLISVIAPLLHCSIRAAIHSPLRKRLLVGLGPRAVACLLLF